MKNSLSNSKEIQTRHRGSLRAFGLAFLALGCALSTGRADWLVVPPQAWANNGLYAYNNSTYWSGGVINDVFYENLNGGFLQGVYFNAADTLMPGAGLDVTLNSTSSYNINAWYLVGNTGAGNQTLQLTGNLYARDVYGGGASVVIGSNVVGVSKDLSLDLNGANRTIYSGLYYDGNGNSGLYIDNPIIDSVGGNHGVTKTGAGALILGAANTFTGSLDIQGGEVVLANNGTLQTSTVNIGAGTTLLMGNSLRVRDSGSGNATNDLKWDGATQAGNRLQINGTVNMDGGAVGFTSYQAVQSTISTSGYSASGNQITLASVAGLAVGQGISGTGIPAGTYITNITGNTITLNNAPSGTLGSSLSMVYAETQTLGTVNLQQGYNIFSPSTGAAFGSAVINIADLNRSLGAVANFAVNAPATTPTSLAPLTVASSGSIGLPMGEADVTLSGGGSPTSLLVNGIIPWANVGGGGFATLAQSTVPGTSSTNYYVTPYSYQGATDKIVTTTSGLTGTTSTSNVELTGAGVNETLTTATEVNSLYITGTNGAISGPSLQIDSGGLILNNGGVTISAPISFNNQEAVVQVNYLNSRLTVSGQISNASAFTLSGGAGTVVNQSAIGFTLPGSDWLLLNNGSNSWTGGTYIDSARLIVGSQTAIPTGSDVFVGAVSAASGILASSGVFDLNGYSITIGSLSGSGIVDFDANNAGNNYTGYIQPTGAYAVTLTLGNATDATFSGQLLNALKPFPAYYGNSVVGSLVKTGSDTETLTGINLYTGTTEVQDGTLAVSGTGTLGFNSAVTVDSGATLDISGETTAPGASATSGTPGGATVAVGSLAGPGAVNVGANFLSTGADETSTTFSGTLTGSGGGLVKTGNGTLTLALANGNSDWSLEVDSGMVLLDHTSSTVADLGTGGLLLGGGTLELLGNSAGTTETAGGLKVKAGSSLVAVKSQGSPTTLALGAITRSAAGGTVDFNSYPGAAVTTTATNVNGILGGWATVNGESDWAQSGASGTNAITAYAGYSDAATAGNWTATSNLSDLTGPYDYTLGGATTVNSLRIDSNGGPGSITATGQTLTIGSGGILETANVGANDFTISGGTLAAGASNELVFIQNNPQGTLSVSSAIGGSTAVTKSGAGTVVLSGSDTSSGATTVNAGKLSVAGTTTLGNGSSALTVASGAVADLTGTGGAANTTAQAFSSLSGNGLVILNSGGLTVGGASDTGSTVDTFYGQISGAGGLTKTGLGTLVLSGGGATTDGRGIANLDSQNTYTGATTISGGILQVTGMGTLGTNSAVTISGTGAGTTFAPAILDLSQATSQITLGSLSGNGTLFLDTLGTVIGSNNSSTTFSGTIFGTGGIIKTGSGTFIFSGTGAPTGDTTGSAVPSSLPRGWTFAQGTMEFDYSSNATSKANNNYIGTFAGGNLLLNGNAGTAAADGFYQTYVNAGASAIQLAGNGAAVTLNLRTITRSAGGTLDVSTVENSGTGILSVTSTQPLGNGILGGWATVNGESDWATTATVNGVASTITAYTGYTVAPTTPGTWSAAANVSDNSTTPYNSTLSGATSVNSIKIANNTGAGSINLGTNALTIASGGILETANVGANNFTISGDSTTPGALVTSNGDLIVIQNNPSGWMDIAAPIGNGTIKNFALTKSGAGTLILDGANVYTGGTYVNAGILQLGSSAGTSATLGTAAGGLTVAAGATADLSRVTGAGGVTVASLAGGGNVITPSAALTANVATASISTFSGTISGSGGLTKTGGGTLLLSGSNSYTGATSVSNGSLLLNKGSLTGTSGVTVSGFNVFGGIGTVNASVTLTGGGTLYAGIPGSGSADGNILAPNVGIQNVGTLMTGALTLTSNTLVDFVLGSAGQAGITYSTIAVNGSLALNGAQLYLSMLDGFGAGTYQLFSYTGTLSGTLTLDPDAGLPSGFDPSLYQLTYGNGVVDLVVSSEAVPEPGTWALLGGGCLLLLGLRRRAAWLKV